MENWKDIKDYEGLYQVSDLGRVKSLMKNIILKPIKHSGGYYQVFLLGKHKYLHRLVAETFLVNPENKKEVNHKDGDKSNNVVYNLEWCTRHENHMHAIETNLNCKKGEKHHNSKLKEIDVIEIRKLRNKLQQKEIAMIYGVSETTISEIVNRKNWQHI